MDVHPLLRLVAIALLYLAAMLGLFALRRWPARRASGIVAGGLAVLALASFVLSALDLLAPRAPVPDALSIYYREGGTVAVASATTGTVRWRYTLPPPYGVFPIPCSLPLDRGVFYVRTDSAIRALSARDGQELWVAPVEGSADQEPMQMPTIDQDVVYASLGASVVALREADGSRLWQTPLGATPGSTPAAPQVANGNVYVAFNSTLATVYALDAGDGAIRWTHTVAGATSASLAVADGMVYAAYVAFAAPKVTVVALDARDGAVRWTSVLNAGADADVQTLMRTPMVTVADGAVLLRDEAQLGLVALDTTSGSLLWQLGEVGQYGALSSTQPPIVANGTVYLAASWYTGTHYGMVQALDVRTGRERWRTLLEYADIAMSLAGPMLYVGGARVYALRASDGHVAWRYGSGSGVQFYQPMAAAGVVFVGSIDVGSSFHLFGIGGNDVLNALDARTGAIYWRSPGFVECMPQVISS